MTHSDRAASSASGDLAAIARSGDLVICGTLVAWTSGSLAIGAEFGSLGLALAASAMLVATAVATIACARGTRLSQLMLTACSAAFVMLHIQLGRGTIEFHFGVFVLLGLLLVYRDWVPIVFAAGLFAVHHLAFDRLQALQAGVFCTPEANFLKTAMHAVYVVAQTSVEIFLARRLRQSAIEAAELSALVRGVDRGDTLCLDVTCVQASAPTARVLKAAIGKMAAAMDEVRRTATQVEQASTEIARGNEHLSQRTEETASNLQQTAASMEQLTATVRHTAGTASEANALAGTASEAATAGGAAVGRVVSTMSDIWNSSRRIADIVGVIDGIAFQTNILALNAAVEAARAGEQGRGFAVVAGEVRSLSQRCAGAAKEIKALIGESVERVEIGARLVGDAGHGMEHIVTHARRVCELIGQISSAATEQTSGIGLIGSSVSALDRVTQQNAAMVEQCAAAAGGLRQQAVQLNVIVGRFVLQDCQERRADEGGRRAKLVPRG